MNAKKLIGTALSVVLCASMLAGCGNQKNETETTTEKGKKTLVIGDTTFNSSNEENNVNHMMLIQAGPVSGMGLVRHW